MADRGFSSERSFATYFLWDLVRARAKCCLVWDATFRGEIKSTLFYSMPVNLSAKCSVKGDGQGPRAGEGPADPCPPPRPAPSLSPQQGRLGWAKDSDGRQSQPSHRKAPPQSPGLARQAAPRARTGSGPEMVTSIIQTRVESPGSQPADQGPGLGWGSTEPSTGMPPGCLWLQLGQGSEAGAGAAAQQQPWVKKGKPLASGSLFQGHPLHCF